MINKLEKLLYNTSIINQPSVTDHGQNLISEYRTFHRWIIQEILYKSLVTEDYGVFYNILYASSCRILSGIIGVNIYEQYTKNNLYLYLLLVILAIIIFGDYILKKKNEKTDKLV